MEQTILLTDKLESLLKLSIFLTRQIESHTNLIAANQALLSRIPHHFHESDYRIMQSQVILNVMNAELKAFHHEAQMVDLQISNIKTEIGIQRGGVEL